MDTLKVLSTRAAIEIGGVILFTLVAVIAASLLMEQVLAPRFNFTPKRPDSGPVEGFDYGEGGYKEGECNVGFNEESGQFQIEIKGLNIGNVVDGDGKYQWIYQKQLHHPIQ